MWDRNFTIGPGLGFIAGGGVSFNPSEVTEGYSYSGGFNAQAGLGPVSGSWTHHGGWGMGEAQSDETSASVGIGPKAGLLVNGDVHSSTWGTQIGDLGC
jgi:hypothetical protein